MPESPKTIQLFVEAPVVADPWQPIALKSDLIVRGWAFAEGGPARVEVLVDGSPARILATGIAREDVMAALGGREEALRTGFEAQLRSIDLAVGKHLVEIRATDRRGATKTATFFVEVVATPRPRASKTAVVKPKGKRALFIDAATPAPDRDAGSNVALAHMKLLQSLGYQVTFVPETLLPAGANTQRLRRLRIETIQQPDYASLEAFLRARGTEFKVAYVHRYTVGEIAIPLLRTHAPRAKVIFNNADLHYLRLEREAAVLGNRALKVAAKRVKARELAVIRSSDCTLLCNSFEQKLLRRVLPRAKLHYLPWVIDTIRRSPKDFAKRRGIMFLGNYGHRPNVDAVKWFVAEVMPLLRNRLPGVKFHAYGNGVTREIEALASEDVVIEGYAPDLDRIFKRHRVSVAPLRFGAGFKGKIAESLARGVPAVATPSAVENVEIIDHVLIGDEPTALLNALSAVYEEQPMWARMSQQGLSYLRRYCSNDAARKVFRSMLAAAR